jgi:hypothetical protein
MGPGFEHQPARAFEGEGRVATNQAGQMPADQFGPPTGA